MKNNNLEWYVLYHNNNKREVTKYNVLAGQTFIDTLMRNIKNKIIYDKKTLKEFLKKEFMHDYWCRSEYEILVTGLHTKIDESTLLKKIDIYTQLEMNLDRIVDYINSECNLKLN